MMHSAKRADVVVIGIGNDFRHDDGAGLHVVRAIQSHCGIPGVSLIESDGDLNHLLSLWEKHSSVIVVDAVCMRSSSHNIVRLDVINDVFPAAIGTSSSHSFGLAETVELARKLNQLPNQFIIYGIPGTCFTVGKGLSQVVQASVNNVVERILLELKSWQKQSNSI